MISSNFIFNFTNLCGIVSFFLTKLLTLDVLFSTAVKAVVVAELVKLAVSFLTSLILALRVVLVTKLVISGHLTSILVLYKSFLTG